MFGECATLVQDISDIVCRKLSHLQDLMWQRGKVFKQKCIKLHIYRISHIVIYMMFSTSWTNKPNSSYSTNMLLADESNNNNLITRLVIQYSKQAPRTSSVLSLFRTFNLREKFCENRMWVRIEEPLHSDTATGESDLSTFPTAAADESESISTRKILTSECKDSCFPVWRRGGDCSQWWCACCVDTRRPWQRRSESCRSVANQAADLLFVILFGKERICQVLPSERLSWILLPIFCRSKPNTSSLGEKKKLGGKKSALDSKREA